MKQFLLVPHSRRRFSILSQVALSALLFSACSATRPAPIEISDPLEGMNRKIFAFNEVVDSYFLGPIAQGYRWALPWWARKGVNNFFQNLRTPVYLLSDIIQGDTCSFVDHSKRFVVNTTAGVVGLVDVAAMYGTPHMSDDIAIALAARGVESGPYLVIPFLGPSNPRDLVGTFVDGFLDPVSYTPFPEVQLPVRALDIVDKRSNLDEAIELGRKSSLDYYSYIQSSYYQYRQGLVENKSDATPLPPSASEDPFVGDQ